MGKILGYLMLLGVAFLLSLSSYLLKSRIQPLELKKTEIILLGDIMLGRTVMTRSLDSGDPTYPTKYVSERLSSADIVFANLENPIIENCPRHYEGYVFCADPKMLESLTHAGVDIVTLANNHTLNYGKDGLEQTKDFLSEVSIDHVGTGNLVIKEMNGVKFGFLGFDFLTNSPTEEDYVLVNESEKLVNVLIVGVHWGVEYTSTPNEHQREWASKLVENGADVIAGHHPHWVQEFDRIGDVPIYYSLGNFVFDQMWSEATRSGVAVSLMFEGSEIVEEKHMPVFMEEWAQPVWVN